MKIIKNINNNYAVAVDGAGNQLIVSGKGIGFGPVPREVEDLSLINRSYYDIDEMYISMIYDIPKDIIDISSRVIDRAREVIDKPLNPNIVFILADHLHFSITRYHKNMNVKLPILYDIQHIFEREYRVGEYGLKLIRDKLKIYLPKEEAAYIALHLINAQEQEEAGADDTDEDMIDNVIGIIEREHGLKIDKNNFNYSRFVSHMHYLLKRGRSKHLIVATNSEVYDLMQKEYPQTFLCGEKVSAYLSSKLKITLSKEEKSYLMLHINRLCTREDCDQ